MHFFESGHSTNIYDLSKQTIAQKLLFQIKQVLGLVNYVVVYALTYTQYPMLKCCTWSVMNLGMVIYLWFIVRVVTVKVS